MFESQVEYITFAKLQPKVTADSELRWIYFSGMSVWCVSESTMQQAAWRQGQRRNDLGIQTTGFHKPSQQYNQPETYKVMHIQSLTWRLLCPTLWRLDQDHCADGTLYWPSEMRQMNRGCYWCCKLYQKEKRVSSQPELIWCVVCKLSYFLQWISLADKLQWVTYCSICPIPYNPWMGYSVRVRFQLVVFTCQGCEILWTCQVCCRNVVPFPVGKVGAWCAIKSYICRIIHLAPANAFTTFKWKWVFIKVNLQSTFCSTAHNISLLSCFILPIWPKEHLFLCCSPIWAELTSAGRWPMSVVRSGNAVNKLFSRWRMLRFPDVGSSWAERLVSLL